MIAEIGHYALVLAFGFALVQGSLPFWGAARGDPALMALARTTALGQFLFLTVAFGALIQAFAVSDFSLVNVAANSHSSKPLVYKISAAWGSHEGSLVLWVWILALYGCGVALFGRNLPAAFRARVLGVQGLIGVGFLAFMLFTSNPFLRLDPAPLDGQGFNPILQDLALAAHPPMLYAGYVGLSMAYAFAIAALIEGRVDASWARWVRPWTLAAWCALSLGIALGSYWAYYELGWGGWWFWDPVENASFMPWLAGTALLHSAVVVEKRGSLKSWTILLAILAFSLSLLGTFLVRSGVLTSVHAFAVDPARGVFVLALLGVAVGGSLALYAWRAPQLQGGGLFAPVSREGGLLLNNLLLSTACATVLLGTLYPLLLETVGGPKISVGPPYFNATFAPLMVPLVAAMPIGAMLAWKRGDLAGVVGRLKAALAVTAPRGGRAARADPGQRRARRGRHGARGLGDRGLAGRARLAGCSSARAAGAELAARQGSAALDLRHDARACRDRRAGRRHHRVERLAERGDPGHAAGRDGDRRRLRLHSGRGRRPAGPELRRAARDLRGQPGRPPGRDAGPREALLPGRAPADLRGRDRHRLAARPLRGPGRSGGHRRRARGAHLPQSAGDVDLGGRRDHGPGRRALADRPPPPHRRADAGPPTPRRARTGARRGGLAWSASALR